MTLDRMAKAGVIRRPLHYTAVQWRRRVTAWLAPWMFGLSLLFLMQMAVLVVMWVDVPALREQAVRSIEAAGDTGRFDAADTESRAGSDSLGGPEVALERSDPGETKPAQVELAQTELAEQELTEAELPPAELAGTEWPYQDWVIRSLLVVWLVFVIEAVWMWVWRPWDRRYRPHHLRGLLDVLIPPLRMGMRHPELAEAIWFPRLGWRRPDDDLRAQLTRFFGIPMLGIAVLILPVLGTEFFLQSQVHAYSALRYGLHFSTGLIWFAFAAEFIIMVSAAERKFAYCKQHWLDLAIILLPVISFLRSLQVLRATRLAKLTKVQQLSKMARVYRLRGVSTKALRALVVFELLHRLLRVKPEKQLLKLRREEERLERELGQLRGRIARVEARLEAECELEMDVKDSANVERSADVPNAGEGGWPRR